MNSTRDGKHPERRGESPSVTGDLASRIAKARGDIPGGGTASRKDDTSGLSGKARAVRMGSEFIAAILVGWGIGFVADRLLGTQPWIMLVMVLVGFAAGVLNIVRAATEMNKAAPAPRDADHGPGGDE